MWLTTPPPHRAGVQAVMLDLWKLVPVAKLLWAARLWRLGLVGSWPWLSTYLLASSAVGVLQSWTKEYYGGANTVAYGWIAPTANAVWWPILLLMILEAYGNVDRQTSGSLGKVLLLSATFAAVVGFFLGDYVPGSYLEQIKRTAYISLAFVWALYLYVALWFRRCRPIGNNEQVMFWILGIWFSGRAAILFLNNWIGVWVWFVDSSFVPVLLMVVALAGTVLFRAESGSGPASNHPESSTSNWRGTP